VTSPVIFRDTLVLVLLVFGIGLAAHAWLRHRNPLNNWNRRGNVWTAPFGIGDVLAIAALLVSLVFLTGRNSTPTEPPTTVNALTVVSGAMFLLGMAGIVSFILHRRGHDLVEVFGLDRMRTKTLVLHSLLWTAAGTALVYLVAHYLWLPILENLGIENAEEQEMVRMLRDSGDAALRIAIALSAVVIAPVAEEVLFRGYLYPSVKAYSGGILAAVVSAGVFTAVHFNLVGLLPLFLFGLLLAAAYEATGSLWLPISIHALFNATTVVYQSIAAT